MIDIENKIFTVLKNSLPKGVYASTSYSKTASRFPLVTLNVTDNAVYESFINSARIENAAEVTIETNTYSNLTTGKKEECKKINKIVDDVLLKCGFTRVSCIPVPNLEDSTIYRMTGRYFGIVDRDLNIYRR